MCVGSWSSGVIHCDARICVSAGQDISAKPECLMLSDLGVEWLWYIVLNWSAVWA